jgi:TonB-dependent SusC/RagA subfamily outer membrane receptor
MITTTRLRALTSFALLGAIAVATGCASKPKPVDKPAPADGTPTASTTPAAPASQGAVMSKNEISPDEMRQVNVQRIEELLQGRVAGLQVLRTPSGELTLRVRGSSSYIGDEEPLLVIDGQPIGQGGVGQALASLTPADIARVRVLKDAAETSFYGSRGANGVVLITTKRAKR